uniref:Macaca fascicularis brain cDNA, clone: QmoA-11009 n=1 Tax=Macaca fascicularis TaxID=9541 RepID=I7G8B9_MACFA|nr:unnamed protein product [Macaca fascicularis]
MQSSLQWLIYVSTWLNHHCQRFGQGADPVGHSAPPISPRDCRDGNLSYDSLDLIGCDLCL